MSQYQEYEDALPLAELKTEPPKISNLSYALAMRKHGYQSMLQRVPLTSSLLTSFNTLPGIKRRRVKRFKSHDELRTWIRKNRGKFVEIVNPVVGQPGQEIFSEEPHYGYLAPDHMNAEPPTIRTKEGGTFTSIPLSSEPFWARERRVLIPSMVDSFTDALVHPDSKNGVGIRIHPEPAEDFYDYQPHIDRHHAQLDEYSPVIDLPR